MVTDMAQFAQSTPLSDRVASLDQPQSLMTVYQAASKDVGAASSLFQNEILDYCIEWESVVSTRVDKEMIATNKLREHYNHYQTKVEGMRKKVNGQEAKGKDIAETVTEKLQRNEQKLVEASADFEGAAAPLCVLIEEVVQEGWKDLYPLIQAAMKWEVDRSQKEARTFQRLQPGELETAFFKVTGQPFQSGTGATSAKKVPPKKVQRESV